MEKNIQDKNNFCTEEDIHLRNEVIRSLHSKYFEALKKPNIYQQIADQTPHPSYKLELSDLHLDILEGNITCFYKDGEYKSKFTGETKEQDFKINKIPFDPILTDTKDPLELLAHHGFHVYIESFKLQQKALKEITEKAEENFKKKEDDIKEVTMDEMKKALDIVVPIE